MKKVIFVGLFVGLAFAGKTYAQTFAGEITNSQLSQSVESQVSGSLAIVPAELYMDGQALSFDADDDLNTFMLDEQHQHLFIDFAAAGGKIAKLVVKSSNLEEPIIQEDLMDIPSDAIYELDLARLPKGSYNVELFTYNTVLSKSIDVK